MSYPVTLFVYGTLMHGLSNHHFLQRCEFLGRSRTAERYGLFVHDYPIVTRRHPTSFIYGELYAVPDAEALDRLDQLESHPDWYVREEIPVFRLHEDGSEEAVTAYLYFNEVIDTAEEGVEAVPSGNLHDAIKVALYKPRE